jgi:hypothetical protein
MGCLREFSYGYGTRPVDVHTPQGYLLVVEALVKYSWKFKDTNPERSCRGWVLARKFARQHGLTVEDALCQREQISKSAL